MIAGGYGELSGKLIRLGHMGVAAHPTQVLAQVALLERVLRDLGVSVPAGAGSAAAIEAFAGWDDATGTYPVAS